jgi:hypothetical protein
VAAVCDRISLNGDLLTAFTGRKRFCDIGTRESIVSVIV